MTQCQDCGGVGLLAGTVTIECAACRGTGALYSQRCFCCDGSGIIETIASDVLCENCCGGVIALVKHANLC